MEIAKVTSKGQLTIPIGIRKDLNISKDDQVVFYINEQNQYVFDKYEPLIQCRHESTPCLLCMNKGEFTYERSLFSHIKSVKKEFGWTIKIEWIEEQKWKITCLEKALTAYEESNLLKWANVQAKKEVL